jgi:hypothetical protein
MVILARQNRTCGNSSTTPYRQQQALVVVLYYNLLYLVYLVTGKKWLKTGVFEVTPLHGFRTPLHGFKTPLHRLTYVGIFVTIKLTEY